MNGCYVEQLSNLGKQVREEASRGFHIPRTQDMVINIEMPGFRPQIPLLQEDRDVSAALPTYVGDASKNMVLGSDLLGLACQTSPQDVETDAKMLVFCPRHPRSQDGQGRCHVHQDGTEGQLISRHAVVALYWVLVSGQLSTQAVRSGISHHAQLMLTMLADTFSELGSTHQSSSGGQLTF